jgi:LysM repeat protein
MKILKIFGLVVGIHVVVLALIFAIPGCSSNTQPPPVPSDTVATPTGSDRVAATPPVSAPAAQTPAPFNPDAPAVASTGSGSPSVRFVPTRPNTPVAGTLVTEPVSDVTPATTYAVKSGDSLWTIAKKHNVTVQQLAAANNLSTGVVLKLGQKLIIPGKSPAGSAAGTTAHTPAAPASGATKAPDTAARPATPAPANSTGGLKHVVKSGETLGAIARQYGVRSGDLAVANSIVDPTKIRPGMELTIPGWDASGAKNGKNGKAAKSGNGSAASKSAPAPTANPPELESTPAATPAPVPQVPVIRIDEGPSPIVPAPR